MSGGHEPRESHDGLALERIVFFSDAVIAIAITLLAIEIRLPEVSEGVERSLTSQLWDLWPRYLSYLISFLAIGAYWWVHHRVFRVVRRYDEGFIWLNLLFLLCIAFLPFASAVLGEHVDEPEAATFYAACITVTGLVEVGLWRYAAGGHRLIDHAVDHRSIRLATLRALTPPVVFALSIPLVWVHPYLGMALWGATFPITLALRRGE